MAKGRSSGQGVKLLYIRDYLYAHATKDHPKNAKAIQAFLATQGIDADVKTIYNDIFRLQTDFGAPIEYNASKWGYYITTPLFEPYELRLMVDSIQASKFITQTEARTISQKITKLADIYTKESLNRTALVADRIRSVNERVVKDADRIHEAIATDRQISFRYFHYTPNRDNPKSYSKSGQAYKVSPHALLWNDGNYYLYAYTAFKQFWMFRVDRMDNISKPLSEKREGKDEFRQQDIIVQKAKVFGMYRGDEYNVRLWVSNKLASAVIDQFGKDIVMIPAGDKHFTFTAPVEISPPFYAWVATFGDRMKILSPEPAVAGMKAFLKKAAEMYKDDES